MDGNNEVKRGRGRPKKGDGIGDRLDIRISPAEKTALDHMLVESERSKSEIVRKAIMLYYHTNRGRW